MTLRQVPRTRLCANSSDECCSGQRKFGLPSSNYMRSLAVSVCAGRSLRTRPDRRGWARQASLRGVRFSLGSHRACAAASRRCADSSRSRAINIACSKLVRLRATPRGETATQRVPRRSCCCHVRPADQSNHASGSVIVGGPNVSRLRAIRGSRVLRVIH